MRRFWMLSFVFMTIVLPARAENWLRVQDGDLRMFDWSFEMWAVELRGGMTLGFDEQTLPRIFQPWCEHGVNAVIFTTQGRDEVENLFASDGRASSGQVGRAFTQLCDQVRAHHLGTVVSLFSVHRDRWLASSEAYQAAGVTAAKLLPRYHSVVFIVGDLNRPLSWDDTSPCPLDDPSNAFAVCRAIKNAKAEAVVGIPASILPMPTWTGAVREPLAYAASSSEALETFAEHLRDHADQAPPRNIAQRVAMLPRQRVLIHDETADGETLTAFLDRVESTRLAVKPAGSLDCNTATRPAVEGQPSAVASPGSQPSTGWISLFDGHSLDGWTTLRGDWGAWCIEDGSIKCRGSRNGPWLRSRARFSSFVLRFEYRIVERGNSGVFVWAPLDGRCSRFGMECQIRGGRGDTLDDTDTTGAIYSVLAPREDASLAALQWNQVEITCLGSKVRIRINGRTVQDINADEVPALRGRLRRGFIGLQDHGNPVWFRNLRIRELAAPPETPLQLPDEP